MFTTTSAQEIDVKALDVSYYFEDSLVKVIKSELEYETFLIEGGQEANKIDVDFENYFLMGYQGLDACYPSNFPSNFSVYSDTIYFDVFVNQGYCMNLVTFHKWFLVNRKFVRKQIKITLHEIIERLEEFTTNCYLKTGHRDKIALIETAEEYSDLFSMLNQSCSTIDFKKHALLVEYNRLAGCGAPKMIKIAFHRNDSLIIQSRITERGPCERLNHLSTSFLIEKRLLYQFKNIGFEKEVSVDWR